MKNKREIWKAQTRLRKYRGQARELLAKVQTGDPQSKKESDQLLMHLNRMNILPAKSTLDDVLALDTQTILSRRLQTIAYLKGLANTPTQARQLIAHGHVAIGNRRVTVPGYMVTKAEEGEIAYTNDSPLNDMMHPARPRSDYSPVPTKKEVKPEEPKLEKEPAKEQKPEAKGEKPKEEASSEQSQEKPADETPKEPAAPIEQNKEEITPEPATEKKPEVEPETPKEEEKPTEEKTEETPVETEKNEEEPKKKEGNKDEEAK